MNEKIIKISALILLVLGIFLIIIQPFQPITGAVIDFSTTLSKINFGIGFVFIIAGIVILQLKYFKKKK
jgi:hypothetical protein